MTTDHDRDRILVGSPVRDLAEHRERGGGRALLRALELGRDAVLDLLAEAGVRGRGGAGFPTATKWRSVLEQAGGGTTYVVANGAEGEPGTLKDRILLAHDPFSVLEGLLVAMATVGAEAGVVCVKEKETAVLERVVAALDELRTAGWHGAAQVQVVPGPEEYLFGEETAMLEVIEGGLPLPRILPPYERGLYADATVDASNPTVVNNVETLLHVTAVLEHGAAWFREVGTEASPGSMLFTVTGDVADPGVYELPLGTPLRVLLEDIAGAQDIKVVVSGVSNPVIVPAVLDTPLCFDAMRDVGAGMGSGGFMVYGPDRDVLDVLGTLVEFLAVESCGQCSACKLGNRAMADLLHRMQRGEASEDELAALVERARTVTDQNRCYLPVGSQALVLSMVAAFEDEVRATLSAGRPTPDDVPVPVLLRIDDATGEVVHDADHTRKRDDWTYA